MALPRAAPPNWPDVEAPPIVPLGKCQGETKSKRQQGPGDYSMTIQAALNSRDIPFDYLQHA